MSKFNSETSFLSQLFKGNSNFTVWKPWKVIYLPVFYDFHCYLYFFPYMFIYAFIHLHINILKPSQCLNSIPRQVFCINFSKIIQNSLGKSHARLFVCLLMMSLFFILLWDKVIYLSMFYDCHYYYLHLFICNYLCIYTPSYQHFKAIPLSKFNSETSFCINFSRRIQISELKSHARLFICLLKLWCLFKAMQDYLFVYFFYYSFISINFSKRIQIS